MSAEDTLPTAIPAHVVKAGGVNRLKFSDERINESLQKQLGEVPAGAKAAVVATAWKDHAGELQTRLAVYINVGDVAGGDLSFGGFLAGDAKRPLDTVGAEVRWVSK